MATNRTTVLARDAKIIAGIGKRLQNGQTALLLGKAYTPDQLTQLFQSQINSTASIAQLRTQLADLVQADRVLAKQINALIKALKGFVENTYGTTTEVLGDFGFAPAKATGTRDPVTKVVAAAKMRSTRIERGTTSKQKKDLIRGATPSTVSISVSSAGKPAGTVVSGNAAATSSGASPKPTNTP